MNNIFNILRKEIRETFRDTKSLLMMIVIPIFIPLIIIGMSAMFDMEVNKPVEEYNKIGFNYKLSEEEIEIAKNLEIEVYEGSDEELKEKYNNGDIDLYIIKNNNNYEINGEDNKTTTYTIPLIKTFFSTYKEYLQNKFLIENNIEFKEEIIVSENIIEEENYFSNYITVYAFLFILMAITVSATYPATDTIAGEKERGTLETLLTFPIKNKDIIIGKYLSVTLSAFITGIVSLILMIISLKISNNNFEIYKDVDLMLSNSSIAFALIIIFLYSFFISGLCIAIVSKSKTFKEAQSAVTPLIFVTMFPGMVAFMADIKATVALSLIPFMNYTLVFDEIVSGTINIMNILSMIFSTVLIIIIGLSIIIKQYKSEKILF